MAPGRDVLRFAGYRVIQRETEFDEELMESPRRRKQQRRQHFFSTLSVVCRDLERRDLWDINALHSLSRFVGDLLQHYSGKRARERIMRGLKEKLEMGVTCGKHLLAGALSAAVCKTVVAPVERVRMDIVLSNTTHGPWRAYVEIMRTEGPLGFWKGNWLNIIRTAPFKAVNFFSFDVYCKLFARARGEEETGDLERFTAGAMAGVTALLACLPLDTVRTRLLSTQSRHQYSGILHAISEIVRTEGFFALYKGCIPGIMSIAPGSAVFYGVYGTLKQAYIDKELMKKGEVHDSRTGLELPVLHTLLYGAIAGMCAEAVVYPLEVIRRQTQLQASTAAFDIAGNTIAFSRMGGALRSFSMACNTIVQTQGLAGFYAGCLLNTAQVLPNAALSYFAYEGFKALMSVNNAKATTTHEHVDNKTR